MADFEKVKTAMEGQTNITDIYQELSYAELKAVLEGWLNPTGDEGSESVSQSTLSAPTPTAPQSAPIRNEAFATEPVVDDRKKMDDVASAFDDLFNN
jgi:hypothetical protein